MRLSYIFHSPCTAFCTATSKSTTYPGISTQIFSSWGRGFCGACIDDEGIAVIVIASPAGQAQAVHRLGRVSIQAALAQKVRRASQLFHPGATGFKIGGCPLMHVSSALLVGCLVPWTRGVFVCMKSAWFAWGSWR